MPKIFSQEQLGQDRVNGFYETPLKTVDYICSKILPHYRRGKKIIDPAVGDGIFLKALAQAGVSPDDLYGYDIDQAKIDALKTRFPKVRLYDATVAFPDRFDFAVGNPPYNGDESHFVRDNRERLLAAFKEIGAKNTFSMISFNAIRALNPGGVFSMILSDAFLTNCYYRKFRAFLLKELEISELLLAPWKLFHGRSADVRTCIITGKKRAEEEIIFELGGYDNLVRLIDRVQSEDEYENPASVETMRQGEFYRYPDASFLIGVPTEIRDIYLNARIRLGDVAGGGTGISTGDDKRFLRKRDAVEGNPAWVPYYKNGARKAYYYVPEFYIERDYRKYSDHIKNYMIRNESFFFKEGVSCSSVGVRFSASYMPPGCLFGVNANFFFKDRDTLYYALGLLNSRLAWYFARRVLVRSNNISSNYLKRLPFIEPPGAEKKRIAAKVREIVEGLRENDRYNFESVQTELNAAFYAIYGLSDRSIESVEAFCSDFYNLL